MPKKKALLFVKLNPPVGEENNFDYWYNEKHIPDRMNLPGFLSARRFTRIAGIPKEYAISPEAEYLALYDLTDINVLRDTRYQALQEKERKLPLESFETRIFGLDKFARGVYEHIYPEEETNSIPRADFVFIVGHEVPINRHQEFNAWYNTEHISALLSVPGFQSVRRFRLNRHDIPPITNKGGTLSTYLTLWDIVDERALESDEFRKASQSPWTDWIRSWYTRSICALYSCVFSME
ncbi:MAG: hypothetical protein JSU58_09825 [Dehalococcoidales bacterium]|nr:MAG: hypothetical protein JSU58_09825 [Dehalococcoidales bacterium]